MPAGDRFDFHLHTRCSDGAKPPLEVLALGARAGLAGVSITDHDTADAYQEIGSAARTWPALRILPGIEVSATCEGVEVHILGYFPQGFPSGALLMAERLLGERGERMRPCDQLVQDNADRPEIGARVDVVVEPLLGRHVRERAACAGLQAVSTPCNAKIQDFDPPGVEDHDVLGLQIAVDDVAPVRGDEGT